AWNRMFVALRFALGMRIGKAAVRASRVRLADGLLLLRLAARWSFVLAAGRLLFRARLARGAGRRTVAFWHCASVAERRHESKSAARSRHGIMPAARVYRTMTSSPSGT